MSIALVPHLQFNDPELENQIYSLVTRQRTGSEMHMSQKVSDTPNKSEASEAIDEKRKAEIQKDSDKPKKIYECSIKSFKRSRDYQSQQQAVLIYLLSRHMAIEIKRPFKLKTESLIFLPITRIFTEEIRMQQGGSDEQNNDRSVIYVKEYVKKRNVEIMKADIESGTSEKLAKRRIKNNECPEILHLFGGLRNPS